MASRPEPQSFVFFVDRSLGKRAIVEPLRSAGAVLEIHDDHFPIDCGDDEWIEAVTAKGWIILSKDKRVRKRSGHLQTLRAAGACVFVLTSGDTKGTENADAFVAALDRMKRIAAKYARPLIATVSRSGHVTIEEGVRRGSVAR